MNTPALEVRNVSKSFGKVQAVQNVSLEVYRGCPGIVAELDEEKSIP